MQSLSAVSLPIALAGYLQSVLEGCPVPTFYLRVIGTAHAICMRYQH